MARFISLLVVLAFAVAFAAMLAQSTAAVLD
jgi:hypothetical protein